MSNKHFKDHQSIVIVKRIVRNETENIKESKHTRVINVETLKIFEAETWHALEKKFQVIFSIKFVQEKNG